MSAIPLLQQHMIDRIQRASGQILSPQEMAGQVAGTTPRPSAFPAEQPAARPGQPATQAPGGAPGEYNPYSVTGKGKPLPKGAVEDAIKRYQQQRQGAAPGASGTLETPAPGVGAAPTLKSAPGGGQAPLKPHKNLRPDAPPP